MTYGMVEIELPWSIVSAGWRAFGVVAFQLALQHRPWPAGAGYEVFYWRAESRRAVIVLRPARDRETERAHAECDPGCSFRAGGG